MRIDLDRPLKSLHAILLSALVCLLAFLMALIATNSKAVALEEAVRLSAMNISDVQVEGEYIYYLEAGSLHCVSTSGRFVWNTGVDTSSSFRVSSGGIAVWRGSRLRIIDIKNGVAIGSVSAGADILTAVVGDVYAAMVTGPEHSSSVILTDLYGNTVDTLTDFDGVTVLDCGFFKGREIFWIMTLDSSGSTPTCKISTYKPGRRETGSISDMDQVIYKVLFRSSNICAVGTDSVKVYDYTGSPRDSETVTVYGWHLECVSGGDDPLMVFAPNAQINDEISIKDLCLIKNSRRSYLHFPVACTQLMAQNDTIYGFSGSYLAVGNYGSAESTVYAMPVNVTNVIGITEKGYAAVTAGSSIYVVKLPEK